MPKVPLAAKLKQTTYNQQQDNNDRFSKADNILLNPAKETNKKEAAEPELKKLVRDGFLIPEDEHQVIQETRQRIAVMGFTANKTEIIRMALSALKKSSDKQLGALYRGLAEVQKGRPKC